MVPNENNAAEKPVYTSECDREIVNVSHAIHKLLSSLALSFSVVVIFKCKSN